MSAANHPGPVTREVAAILRGRIARANVTQQELAEVAGVSQSQLSKVLRGTKPIDLDLLERLTFALGLDMVDVLREADDLNNGRPMGAWLLDESGMRHSAAFLEGVRAEGRGATGPDDYTLAARDTDDDAEAEAQQIDP